MFSAQSRQSDRGIVPQMDVKGEVKPGGTEGEAGPDAEGSTRDTVKGGKPDNSRKVEKTENGGRGETNGAGNQEKPTSEPKKNRPNQGKTEKQGEGKKKKRRKGKGKKNREEEPQVERRDQTGRGRRKGTRRLQRVYAWYRCKTCNRHWESSQTQRVIGTVIVPFKQGCKKCQEKMGSPSFTGPYRSECFECGAPWCHCGYERERYNPYYDYYDNYDSSLDYGYDEYDYIDEVTRREKNVDEKKPHLSSLCERCLQLGFSCVLNSRENRQF